METVNVTFVHVVQVFPVHLNNFTNNPNAYIMFYERERSSLIENTNSMTKPSAMSNLIASINSGGMNGASQQRTNGYLTKRENSFSSSSNHSKYVFPCCELLTGKLPGRRQKL